MKCCFWYSTSPCYLLIERATPVFVVQFAFIGLQGTPVKSFRVYDIRALKTYNFSATEVYVLSQVRYFVRLDVRFQRHKISEIPLLMSWSEFPVSQHLTRIPIACVFAIINHWYNGRTPESILAWLDRLVVEMGVTVTLTAISLSLPCIAQVTPKRILQLFTVKFIGSKYSKRSCEVSMKESMDSDISVLCV